MFRKNTVSKIYINFLYAKINLYINYTVKYNLVMSAADRALGIIFLLYKMFYLSSVK